MPQSSPYLRKIFKFEEGGDGINNAEKVIKDAGGVIEEGWILIKESIVLSRVENLSNAIQFLCEEWDYGIKIKEGE